MRSVRNTACCASGWMLEGAVFRTEQDNARETDPTNSNNIVLTGNQLVKGMQASAVGRLGGGTDLVLGYAYLDSSVLFSKEFPSSIGYPLANVPKQTFNAFLTHDLPFKLSAGFGGNYVESVLKACSSRSSVPLRLISPAKRLILHLEGCPSSDKSGRSHCSPLAIAQRTMPLPTGLQLH